MPANPWLFKNITNADLAISIHYSEIRKVDDPLTQTIDNFMVNTREKERRGLPVITREFCSEKHYPRVLRARRKVKDLEAKLQDEMLGKFEGLSSDQKQAIVALVEQNTKMRNLHRQKLEKIIPEDLGPTNENEETNEQGPKFLLNDLEEISTIQNHPQPQFYVEKYVLQAIREKNEEDSAIRSSRIKPNNTSASVPQTPEIHLRQATELSPREKYKTFVDRNTHIRHVEEDHQATLAYQQISKVTHALDDWVRENLDTEVKLVDPLAPKPKSPPKDSKESHSISVEGAESVTLPPINHSNNKVHSGPGHFDILFNACKPSILETKPLMKFKISVEHDAPPAVLNSLKRNFGLNIDSVKLSLQKHNRKYNSIYASDEKIAKHERLNYGSWFVQPEKWNEVREKKGEEERSRKAAAARRRKLRGIVQQKLDQLNSNRLKEEAILKDVIAFLDNDKSSKATTSKTNVSSDDDEFANTPEAAEVVESEEVANMEDAEKKSDEQEAEGVAEGVAEYSNSAFEYTNIPNNVKDEDEVVDFSHASRRTSTIGDRAESVVQYMNTESVIREVINSVPEETQEKLEMNE